MLRFRIPAKLYSSETLLERLAQDIEDLVGARGPFLQEEHAVWCARDTAPVTLRPAVVPTPACVCQT
jgi:hypothetical protein